MPRTKIAEHANRAVEDVEAQVEAQVEAKDRITDDSRQAQEHYAKWEALIAQVKLVHKFAAKLRKRLEDHANDHPEAEPPPLTTASGWSTSGRRRKPYKHATGASSQRSPNGRMVFSSSASQTLEAFRSSARCGT